MQDVLRLPEVAHEPDQLELVVEQVAGSNGPHELPERGDAAHPHDVAGEIGPDHVLDEREARGVTRVHVHERAGDHQPRLLATDEHLVEGRGGLLHRADAGDLEARLVQQIGERRPRLGALEQKNLSVLGHDALHRDLAYPKRRSD